MTEKTETTPELLYEGKYVQHLTNVEAFKTLMANHPGVGFYHPAPIAAPWHVKARINGHDLNFWPHKCSGSIDGGRTKHGIRALEKMLIDAILSRGQGVELIE